MTQLEYDDDVNLRRTAAKKEKMGTRQKLLDELKQWLIRAKGVQSSKVGELSGAPKR